MSLKKFPDWWKGIVARRVFWDVPGKWYFLWIPAGGAAMFFLGIVVWGGFNTAIEWTNREAFCIGCHEMRDNVYPEYRNTIHYKNRTGVRATCPDCHVPRPWLPEMARKAKASLELIAKVRGTIDTREKFEAHRLELATDVWATMKSTDSRECRNCHAYQFMDTEKQDKFARKKHSLKYIARTGKTCIDCHKGIAHRLPKT